MIRVKKPIPYGINKLSELVPGKSGLVLSYDLSMGGMALSKDSMEIVRTDDKNIVLTDDCIHITSGSDETFLSGKNGCWIGNYYDYRSFCEGTSVSNNIILEEFPETGYSGSTYVFVVEGRIDGGGILEATGSPKTFNFGGKSYQYVTYRGNLLAAAMDDVTISANFAASFTGRYAERWLKALENHSFLCAPTIEWCVEPFDVSINDGYSTVTSLVPVKNVYLANCLTSRALLNINYEVIGEFYGDLGLILYEPEYCQLPYRFLIRNLNANNRQCSVLKYADGNGGSDLSVMWLTSNRMELGATYVLTVQGCVARLDKVIESIE